MTRSRHRSSKSSAPVRGSPFSASNCRWWTWMANRCRDGQSRGVSAGQRALGGKQYYGQDASALTAAGWFDTGDIGTLDAEWLSGNQQSGKGYYQVRWRVEYPPLSWRISPSRIRGCAARRPSPPAIRAGTSGRCCCASVRKGAKWRRPIC